MASRKTASKTSKKATVDLSFKSDNKSSKRNNKKIAKQLKKLSFGAMAIALLILVVGVLGGFFGVKFLVRNDCFELNGKDEITLQIGETYSDEGAKVIAFGKNDENKLTIKTNLKQNTDGTYYAEEEGTYYITYSVDNFKYGTLFKIQKVRLITFVEATEQEEIESAQGGNS